MKKITVYEQTVAATNSVISEVQQGITPNLYSWDLWTESLLRYVLYHDSQRIYAQGLETLGRQIIEAFGEGESILNSLQQFSSQLAEIEALIKDGNQYIEWEPPFDIMYNTIP
jgi:hypothetical protein